MLLPSAIAVELKLSSIELKAVQALSVTEVEDTAASADAAGLSTGDGGVSVALETALRVLRIFGSLRAVPCTRSPTHTKPTAA
jgi:hypothetical protein